MPSLTHDILTHPLLTHGSSADPFHSGVPVLGNGESPQFPVLSTPVQNHGHWRIQEQDGLLMGAAQHTADHLDEGVRTLYSEFLHLCKGWFLYRVWHFIPQINTIQNGLEEYRRFSRTRYLAFEEANPQQPFAYPAASATGTPGDHFSMVFLAGRERPRFLENPLQLPAFQYPTDYGPKPPAFSRAVVIPSIRSFFASGTSSIRGHRTIGQGSITRQTAITLENLQIVFSAAHLQLEALAPPTGSLTVYVRKEDDLPSALPLLRKAVPGIVPNILLSDICRSDLDIEIEAYVWTGE